MACGMCRVLVTQVQVLACAPSKNKAVHPKAEIEMILPETAFFVCFSKGIPWDAQSHRAPKFFFDFFFVFALVNWAVKLENFRLNLRMNSLVVPY